MDVTDEECRGIYAARLKEIRESEAADTEAWDSSMAASDSEGGFQQSQEFV